MCILALVIAQVNEFGRMRMLVCVPSADIVSVILFNVEFCIMLMCGLLDEWMCLG